MYLGPVEPRHLPNAPTAVKVGVSRPTVFLTVMATLHKACSHVERLEEEKKNTLKGLKRLGKSCAKNKKKLEKMQLGGALPDATALLEAEIKEQEQLIALLEGKMKMATEQQEAIRLYEQQNSWVVVGLVTKIDSNVLHVMTIDGRDYLLDREICKKVDAEGMVVMTVLDVQPIDVRPMLVEEAPVRRGKIIQENQARGFYIIWTPEPVAGRCTIFSHVRDSKNDKEFKKNDMVEFTVDFRKVKNTGKVGFCAKNIKLIDIQPGALGSAAVCTGTDIAPMQCASDHVGTGAKWPAVVSEWIGTNAEWATFGCDNSSVISPIFSPVTFAPNVGQCTFGGLLGDQIMGQAFDGSPYFQEIGCPFTQ